MTDSDTPRARRAAGGASHEPNPADARSNSHHSEYRSPYLYGDGDALNSGDNWQQSDWNQSAQSETGYSSSGYSISESSNPGWAPNPYSGNNYYGSDTYSNQNSYSDSDTYSRYNQNNYSSGDNYADYNSYSEPTDYQNQNTYLNQNEQTGGFGYSDYQSQSGYDTQSGYQTQSGYNSQSGYHTQTDYDNQYGYNSQFGYDTQSNYSSQNDYQTQGGYDTQSGYQTQSDYYAKSGYDTQSGYSTQPGYANPYNTGPQSNITDALNADSNVFGNSGPSDQAAARLEARLNSGWGQNYEQNQYGSNSSFSNSQNLEPTPEEMARERVDRLWKGFHDDDESLDQYALIAGPRQPEQSTRNRRASNFKDSKDFISSAKSVTSRSAHAAAAGAKGVAHNIKSTAASASKTKGFQAPAWLKILIILAVTAVVIFGIVFVKTKFFTAEVPKVGDCVSMSGTQGSTKAKIHACDDHSQGVTYKIVHSVSSAEACGPNDVAYNRINADTKEVIEVLCMVPDLQQGKCYSATNEYLTHISCESPDEYDDTVFKVIQRLEQAQGDCGENPNIGIMSFDDPGITYCTGSPTEE